MDYSTVGQVKITMLDYIDEIIYAFDKVDPKVGGTYSSTASDIIFKFDEECKKLNSKRDVEFHHLVAKNNICYQAGQDGHLHQKFIPRHESERNRQ